MKKLTNLEIIHHFANRVAKEEKGNSYSYRNNTLFYKDTCIAKIISVRKKMVVLQKDFDRVGRFGNGYNSSTIEHSFSDNWTIFYGTPTEDLKYNKKTIYQLFLSTLKPVILSRVDKYLIERELITNRSAYKEVWYKEHAIEPYVDLAIDLNINLNRVNKHIYNEYHCTTVRYYGWGKSEQKCIRIDKPISFWLNEDLWWDESERRILEFKKWKYKVAGNSNMLTTQFRGKTYLEIWKNDELRTAFENRIQDIEEHKRIQREELEKKTNEARIEENKKKLEEWFNSGNYTLWYIPVELRLVNVIKGKLDETQTSINYENKFEQEVETTKGARVPLHHAERLFKFFKKCIAENKPYENITLKSNNAVDTIGVYHLRKIDKDDKGWYLTAGCHIIYEDAIDRFVERYKFNW